LEWKRSGETISIRLDRGEDIHSSIKEVCRKEGVLSASVSGIGACSKAGISHFDTKENEYHGKTLEGMMEILSLSGNVTSDGGGPMTHLHIVLGLPDFGAVGGHLGESAVDPTCEIKLRICGASITRKLDPGSGLKLQSFE